MRSLFGIGTSTPTHLQGRVKVRKPFQANNAPVKRTRMPKGFVVPVLNCKRLNVTHIKGARTIIWQHDTGTVYHQDCSTPVPGYIGMSWVYRVSQ